MFQCSKVIIKTENCEVDRLQLWHLTVFIYDNDFRNTTLLLIFLVCCSGKYKLYYNLRQVVVANCVDCRLFKNAAALITKYLASIHYKVPQFLSHIASVRKGKGKGIWTTFPFQSFPFERYITKCVNCYKISQESSSSIDCGVLERSVGSLIAL